MQFNISLNFLFVCYFEPLKKGKNKVLLKFHLNFYFRSRKLWWAKLLTNRLYNPHETYVSGFFIFIALRRSQKPQSILSLLSQGLNSLPSTCSDLDLKNGHICFAKGQTNCSHRLKSSAWAPIWKFLGSRIPYSSTVPNIPAIPSIWLWLMQAILLEVTLYKISKLNNKVSCILPSLN